MKLDLTRFDLPLDGSVFVFDGEQNLLDLFLDESLTVAVAQPILLKNGAVWLGGNVITLFANGDVASVDIKRW